MNLFLPVLLFKCFLFIYLSVVEVAFIRNHRKSEEIETGKTCNKGHKIMNQTKDGCVADAIPVNGAPALPLHYTMPHNYLLLKCWVFLPLQLYFLVLIRLYSS